MGDSRARSEEKRDVRVGDRDRESQGPPTVRPLSAGGSGHRRGTPGAGGEGKATLLRPVSSVKAGELVPSSSARAVHGPAPARPLRTELRRRAGQTARAGRKHLLGAGDAANPLGQENHLRPPRGACPTSACVFQKSASLELFTSQLMTSTSGRQRMCRVCTCGEGWRWKRAAPREAPDPSPSPPRPAEPPPRRVLGAQSSRGREPAATSGQGCVAPGPSPPLPTPGGFGWDLCDLPGALPGNTPCRAGCQRGWEPNLQHPPRTVPTD